VDDLFVMMMMMMMMMMTTLDFGLWTFDLFV